jgi:hypothetical protein
MQTLRPFQGTLPIDLQADLIVDKNMITISYQLDLCTSIVGVSSGDVTTQHVSRKDQLWTTTCFEAFLNPVGTSKYFEFNFSLQPAWNVYEFTGYREPQPPLPSEAFELQSFQWNARQKLLNVQIKNKTEITKFNVSLTAVIEETNGTKHYCALTHAESKADFHALKSFTLLRGI